MKKLFFFKKNITLKFLTIFFIFLFFTYIFLFYLNINKPIFYLKNNETRYFIIPKDKEGEKIEYLDKKSINNKKILNNIVLSNVENLNYTIQLFSDLNYLNVKIFMDNFINFKSEIINQEDLFIFAIETSIGIDYFLTYKNFLTKKEANNYCDNSNIIKKCLILNLTTD